MKRFIHNLLKSLSGTTLLALAFLGADPGHGYAQDRPANYKPIPTEFILRERGVPDLNPQPLPPEKEPDFLYKTPQQQRLERMNREAGLNPQPLPPDKLPSLNRLNPQPLPPDKLPSLNRLNPQPLPPDKLPSVNRLNPQPLPPVKLPSVNRLNPQPLPPVQSPAVRPASRILITPALLRPR